MLDALGHEQQCAEQRHQAEGSHHQEGHAPAEMLADEGTQRDTGDKGHGHATEHGGDSAGGFFFRHQAGGDDRADREEHPVGQAGENARHDQRFVTGRLPGHQVTGGEQCHQADQ